MYLFVTVSEKSQYKILPFCCFSYGSVQFRSLMQSKSDVNIRTPTNLDFLDRSQKNLSYERASRSNNLLLK